MLFVLLVGLSLWVVYGIMKQDAIIIVANSFSLLINVTTLVFTFIHRRHAS
jgi:MtN3 and saliva related transmembrane protein